MRLGVAELARKRFNEASPPFRLRECPPLAELLSEASRSLSNRRASSNRSSIAEAAAIGPSTDGRASGNVRASSASRSSAAVAGVAS